MRKDENGVLRLDNGEPVSGMCFSNKKRTVEYWKSKKLIKVGGKHMSEMIFVDDLEENEEK